MKQNNDIPDKIMERIRKLMRLKESTTSEGEARETALTCCHDALIDKYLEKIGAGTSKARSTCLSSTTNTLLFSDIFSPIRPKKIP